MEGKRKEKVRYREGKGLVRVFMTVAVNFCLLFLLILLLWGGWGREREIRGLRACSAGIDAVLMWGYDTLPRDR